MQVLPPNVHVLKHFKGRTNEKSKDVTTLDWNVRFFFLRITVFSFCLSTIKFVLSFYLQLWWFCLSVTQSQGCVLQCLLNMLWCHFNFYLSRRVMALYLLLVLMMGKQEYGAQMVINMLVFIFPLLALLISESTFSFHLLSFFTDCPIYLMG